jgi:DNA repair exonuclease SbcCD ATPase subunit
MNLDERLEAISTQLELLTHMQADTERRFRENERRTQENERRFQENEQRFRENEQRFRENEQRFRENEQRFRELIRESEGRFQANERRFEKVVDLLTEVGSGIRSLTRVAELHEDRITRLEDRQAS